MLEKINLFLRDISPDIYNHIISYTYNCQDKTLLEDIQNYKETKNKINKFYTHKYWLRSDIITFLNDYKGTGNGFDDKFYNILSRQYNLITKQDVDSYFIHLEHKDVTTQNNVLWGLLNPTERIQMITYVFDEYERHQQSYKSYNPNIFSDV